MTGTSIDGIDAALVRVHGVGLAMTAEVIGGVSQQLGELSTGLRTLAEQRAMTAGEIAKLARDFSLAHARAVKRLLDTCKVEGRQLSAISVHGQTVFHQPPMSWQMFNPWPLVHEIGAPVVFDLRGADIAAGGQGAPMTPIADWVLFRPKSADAGARAIVNLGGFCNVTLLGSGGVERVRGFDVCACNLLLDEVARRVLGVKFDQGGVIAQSGRVHRESLDELARLLAAQGGGRRSLGTGDEVGEWVSRWSGRVTSADMAATACEGVGRTIAQRLLGEHPGIRDIVLAGGGAYNRTLVTALARHSSATVRLLDELGVAIGMREAAEMAVLGALCQDGVAITLPNVTGVREPAPVAGCWAGR